MHKITVWLLLLNTLLMTACSLTEFAVDTGAEIVVPKAVKAIMVEDDLEFIKTAIPGNVKLLEGLLELSPYNRHLNEALAQSFLFYSLAFVEEEYQEAKYDDDEKAEALSDRAKRFYLRGRKHGLRMLVEHEAFNQYLLGDMDKFEESLKDMEKEDVPGLVYFGMNWLLFLTHSMDSPKELIHIGRIKLMVQRAVELDAEFFFGLPLLALGSFESSIPPALGGRPELGRKHFERAIAVSNGKFLLSKVMFAERYAAQMLDEELFTTLLTSVLETPDNVMPNFILPNVIAKKQAKRLLKQKNEIF